MSKIIYNTKIAIRLIIRNKVFSVINIMGLAIGLACTILILIWVKDELSFDKYHKNSDNIYRVIYEQHHANQVVHSAVSPIPLGEALISDFPEILDYSRYGIFFGEVLLSWEDKRFYEDGGCCADPGFLNMFTVEFLSGNPETALNDPSSIILTESFAEKYFGDEDPLNKIIMLESSQALKVTGVIKDVPATSHLKYDFIVPFVIREKWGTVMNNWKDWGSQYTYILLNSNSDINDVNNNISEYLNKFISDNESKLYLQSLKEIYLDDFIYYDNYARKGDYTLVVIFTAIALIILIVACINFINLTTARASTRYREVAVKKAIGAHRKQLIQQFFIESVLITIIALYVSLIIVEIMRPSFNSLIIRNIQINYFDINLILGLLGLTIITATLSGFYPAIMLSSFLPVHIFQGFRSYSTKKLSGRNILVIIQFFLAICLIIFSIMIYKQFFFVRNTETGINTRNVLYSQIRGPIRTNFDNFKNDLLQNPDILNVSSGSSLSTLNSNSSDDLLWEGKEIDASFELISSTVDFDYIETFGLKIINGRSFNEDFTTDIGTAYILNEKAIEMMGIESAVGKSITFNETTGNVIGILKDFRSMFPDQPVEPIIMRIIHDYRNYYFIKLNDNIDQSETIDFIKKSWKKYSSFFPCEPEFIDDYILTQYQSLKNMLKAITWFTLLAIIISCLGLFAMASFITEQRKKEIGIRKVNGATVGEIIFLLVKSLSQLVFYAFIIACPVSYLIVNKWLQNFDNHTNISWWVFMVSGLFAILIALLTVGYRAFNAARKNPVDSLRHE
ncbi:ABC transporter permease [Bacteroidota bacterium]